MFHFARRRISTQHRLLLVFLFTLTLLAACSNATPLIPAEVDGSAQRVKVLYWGEDYPPQVELDRKYIQEFMEANPDIEVEYEVAADYDAKLRTALAAGSGPDLFYQSDHDIAQFYLSGIIVPIDPAAMGLESQQALIDQYTSPETILNSAIFDSKLYGVPMEVSTYACFLNTKLWQEAGLDPESDFPAYWDDFPALMAKLSKRDNAGTLTQRGFDFNWTAPEVKFDLLVSLAQQLGAMPIDEENFNADLTSPEMEQALQFITDYVVRHDLGGPGYQPSRRAFRAGTLATECSYGSWGAGMIHDAGVEFTIHEVPTFRNAKSQNHFSTYTYFHMVNARAAPEVQQAAWKLANFLSQHPQEYLTGAGLFQPKKELVESAAFQENPFMPIFLAEMQTNYHTPRIAGYFEVAEAVARAIDRSVLENMDVAESLSIADTEVNEILKRQRAALTAAK